MNEAGGLWLPALERLAIVVLVLVLAPAPVFADVTTGSLYISGSRNVYRLDDSGLTPLYDDNPAGCGDFVGVAADAAGNWYATCDLSGGSALLANGAVVFDTFSAPTLEDLIDVEVSPDGTVYFISNRHGAPSAIYRLDAGNVAVVIDDNIAPCQPSDDLWGLNGVAGDDAGNWYATVNCIDTGEPWPLPFDSHVLFNGAIVFTLSGTAFMRGLDVAPDGSIYVTTVDALYRSIDGGANFALIAPLAPNDYDSSVAVDTEGKVYLLQPSTGVVSGGEVVFPPPPSGEQLRDVHWVHTTDEPCPVSNASGEMENISGYVKCDPDDQSSIGRKMPSWGQFGSSGDAVQDGVLHFDSGERLELVCTDASTPYFELIYTPVGGDPKTVGICPWEGGCNHMWFFHSGDNVGADGMPGSNKIPDCLVKTRSRSKDYSVNDDDRLDQMGNPTESVWTGLLAEFPAQLDWAWVAFEVGSEPRKSVEKYEYVIAGNPPVAAGTCRNPNLERPEGNLVDWFFVNPPLWPNNQRRSRGVGATAMEEDYSFLCDFDGNGSCDSVDEGLLDLALSSCVGDAAFRSAFDIDGNECIDEDDRLYLFILDSDGDGIANVADNCAHTENPGQADVDGDGVGDTCDNCLAAENRNQLDSDGDGIGNACDADLNGDCAVNFGDLAALKAVFFPNPYDPDADFDGDGFVNFGDLAFMKASFFNGASPGPGPSGIPNDCE